MIETAIKSDRWHCPYLKIRHADKDTFELIELCEVRSFSECLLVNGDRCGIYEQWLKEKENG